MTLFMLNCCTWGGGPWMVQLQSTAVWLRALLLRMGFSGWVPLVWWWDRAVGLSPILVWAHTATSYTVPAVRLVAAAQIRLNVYRNSPNVSYIWIKKKIPCKQYLWVSSLWLCSSCSPWRGSQTARRKSPRTVSPLRDMRGPTVRFIYTDTLARGRGVRRQKLLPHTGSWSWMKGWWSRGLCCQRSQREEAELQHRKRLVRVD